MKMEDCINFLLTGAQHRVFQILKKDLEKYDLTPIQYGVLRSIWSYGSKNPKDIAEKFGIENSTISGILERMENKGLLVRNIDSEDRRFIRIELTEAGRELEKPVNATVDAFNKRVLAPFSKEEVEMLREILGRIAVSEKS